MGRILLLTLISAVPGWPLRRLLYSTLFGYRFGKGARIAMLSVVDARQLDMAEGAKVRGAKNLLLNLHELTMGPYSRIGGPRLGGCRAVGTAHKPGYPHAALRLGPCSVIEMEHYFDVCADIEFGANVIVGGLGSYFFTHTFHRPEFMPIHIGNNVYVGTNCRFQMGSSVGDGCIVGMGAVVVRPIEATGALLGGVPAKVIAEDAEYDAPAAFVLRGSPYFDGERVVHPSAG